MMLQYLILGITRHLLVVIFNSRHECNLIMGMHVTNKNLT